MPGGRPSARPRGDGAARACGDPRAGSAPSPLAPLLDRPCSSATSTAWRSLSGAAAASMRPISSSTARATVGAGAVEALGSAGRRRRAGHEAGSRARTRARSRLPRRGLGGRRGTAGSTPSATRAAPRQLIGDRGRSRCARTAMAMVTSSGGTSSATMHEHRARRGSSIVFSRRGGTSGSQRWISSRMNTLRSPSTGDRTPPDDSASLLCRTAAPTRWTSWTSGWLAGQGEAARAARCRHPPSGHRSAAAKPRAAARFAHPGRPDEQVGVHGRARRSRRRATARCLADHARPESALAHAVTPARPARRRPRRPPRPRSGAVDHDPPVGLLGRHRRKPSATRSWNPRPPLEAVELRRRMRRASTRGISVEQDDEVGPAAADGPLVDRPAPRRRRRPRP